MQEDATLAAIVYLMATETQTGNRSTKRMCIATPLLRWQEATLEFIVDIISTI